MTDHDPGFKWFHDYYHQCTSEDEARAVIQVGTPVCLDPGGLAEFYLASEVDADGFWALTIDDPKKSIRVTYRDVVFPGNILYVLEFDTSTQAAAEAAVLIRRLQHEDRIPKRDA